MIFGPSIELGPPVCEHTQYRYFLFFKEGYYPVIEHVSGSNGMFTGIQFGKGDTGVGINNSLLIDSAYALNRSHVVGVLCNQIAGMFCFNLTMGFLLFLLAFHGDHLGFTKNQSFLRNTRL